MGRGLPPLPRQPQGHAQLLVPVQHVILVLQHPFDEVADRTFGGGGGDSGDAVGTLTACTVGYRYPVLTGPLYGPVRRISSSCCRRCAGRFRPTAPSAGHESYNRTWRGVVFFLRLLLLFLAVAVEGETCLAGRSPSPVWFSDGSGGGGGGGGAGGA
ncbi:unnamed protein product, partial [Ectocarpus fasciculatus]